MGTDPLIDDGHPSVSEQIQVLCGRFEPHHLRQQAVQLPQFFGIPDNTQGLRTDSV